MRMIAKGDIKNSKQSFECLRCGHEETQRVE
jgi:transcription elongation factor Elf1